MRAVKAAALAWLAGVSPAMAAAPPLAELTLEALLELPVVEVAGEVPLSAREAPGVVSVVSREEILDAGAGDLIDVLRLVPGFFFGVDVQGMTGVGFRGNWGHEGKILLLIDGQELNELDYGTLQFGNRFPVDQILGRFGTGASRNSRSSGSSLDRPRSCAARTPRRSTDG